MRHEKNYYAAVVLYDIPTRVWCVDTDGWVSVDTESIFGPYDENSVPLGTAFTFKNALSTAKTAEVTVRHDGCGRTETKVFKLSKGKLIEVYKSGLCASEAKVGVEKL